MECSEIKNGLGARRKRNKEGGKTTESAPLSACRFLQKNTEAFAKSNTSVFLSFMFG